jgi:HSP20 family protein
VVKRAAKLYGPIVELSRLQSEINRLFAAFVEANRGVGATATAWDPSVDVLDDGETIRVLIELPGVESADVRVTIRGRLLTVKGQKKGRIRSREGLRFFCMERYFGTFVKSVPLPRPVNTHQARSMLRDGMLEVQLPRVPDQREKEYELEVKGEED